MSWLGMFWGSKGDGKERKDEQEEVPPRTVNGGDFSRPAVEPSRTGAPAPFSTPHPPRGDWDGAGSTPHRLDASRQLHPGGRAMEDDHDRRDPFPGGGASSSYEYFSSLSLSARRAAVASEPPASYSPVPRASSDRVDVATEQLRGASASGQMTEASPWTGATPQRSLRPAAADRADEFGAMAMAPQLSEAPSAASYRRRFGGSSLRPYAEDVPNAAEPASVGRSSYKPRTSAYSTGARTGPASLPRRAQQLSLAMRMSQGYYAAREAQQRQVEANRGAGRLWSPTGRIISKRSRLPPEEDDVSAAVDENPAKRQRRDPSDDVGDPKVAATTTTERKKAATENAPARATAPSEPTVPVTQPPSHRRRRRLGKDVTVEIKGSTKVGAQPSGLRGIGFIDSLRKQPPVGAERLNMGFTKEPVPTDALRIKPKGGREATPKRASAEMNSSSNVPRGAAEPAASAEPKETGQRAPPFDSRVVSSRDPSYPMGGNWGNLFQGLNEKNKWKCKVCNLWNDDERLDKCKSCESPRYAWKCGSCNAGHDDDTLTRCPSCGADRPATTAELEPDASAKAVGAAPPTSSFVFGAPAAASSAASTATAAIASKPTFTFGIPSTTTNRNASASAAPSPATAFQFTATPSAVVATAQAGTSAPAPAALTWDGTNAASLQMESSSASSNAKLAIPMTSTTGSSFGFTFPGQMNGSKSANEKPSESKAPSRSSELRAPDPSPVPPSVSLIAYGQGTGATPSHSALSTDRPEKRRATGNQVLKNRASESSSNVLAIGPPAPAAPSSVPAVPFGFPPNAKQATTSSDSVRDDETRLPDTSTSRVPPAPFVFGSQPDAGSASAPSLPSNPPTAFSDPFASSATGAPFSSSASRKRSSGASESASAPLFGIGSSTGLGPTNEQNKALPFASTPAPEPASNVLATATSFGPTGSEMKAGIGKSAPFGAQPFGQNAGFGSGASVAREPSKTGPLPGFVSTTAAQSTATAPFTFGSSSSTAASSSNQQTQHAFQFGATPTPATTVGQFGSAPSVPALTTVGPQFGSAGPPFGASSTFPSTSSTQPAAQFGFGGQAQTPAGSTGFQPPGVLSASSSQSATTGFSGGSSFGLSGGSTVPAPAPSFGGFGGPSLAAPAPAAFGQLPQQQPQFGVGSAAPGGGYGSSGAAPAAFMMGQAPKAPHGRRIVRAKRP